MTTAPEPLPVEDRHRVLSVAVQSEVMHGARVESQNDRQAVVVHGKPVNHVLHLLLTLVTCGLWGPVWLILVLSGGEKRRILTVDDWGQVFIR